jgi:HEAT repeat protein
VSVLNCLLGVAVFALWLWVWVSYFDPVARWKRTIRDDNEGGRRWEAASKGVRGQIPGVDRAMVVGELTAALGDPSWRVRQTSASNLGGLGPEGEAAVPALVGALKDVHPWVREAAINALGQILVKSPGRRGLAVPSLVAMLKDSQFHVRMAAAFNLARMDQGEAALPTLIEALSREDLMMRAYAIWAIGRIGPKGRPAVPALLAVASDCAPDPNPFMRLRGVEAAGVLASFGETAAARRMLAEASKDPDPMVRKEAGRVLNDLEARAASAPPGP